MLRTRRQTRNEKQVIVDRFYSDWSHYTNIHANSPSGDTFTRRVNSDGSITLSWISPYRTYFNNKQYDSTELTVTLLHPVESCKQIAFEMCYYVNTLSGDDEQLIRESSCYVIPTLNLASSMLMSMLILNVGAVVRRNRLPLSVANTLFTIYNSILFDRYVMSPTLYDWSNYSE